MKLTTMSGIYNDNEIQVDLPTAEIVREALLKLDYSQGIIQNQDAADQLAKQFCLSDEQKNIVQDNGVNIWLNRVNGAIQALAGTKKLVRTKDATIITVEALKDTVADFLHKLGYEAVEVGIDEIQADDFNFFIEIGTKLIQGKGLKFNIAATPTETPTTGNNSEE